MVASEAAVMLHTGVYSTHDGFQPSMDPSMGSVKKGNLQKTREALFMALSLASIIGDDETAPVASILTARGFQGGPPTQQLLVHQGQYPMPATPSSSTTFKRPIAFPNTRAML